MLRVCKFRSSSSVWAWGKGVDLAVTPHVVATVPECPVLANGMDHSAFVSSGTIWTYGSNKHSQLGRLDPSPSPMAIESNSEVSSLACGAWHTVAVHANGSVSSFGWGGSWMSGAGGLGLGSKAAVLQPTEIPQLNNIAQVACGNQHTLFLTQEGSIWSTGHGAYGILGTGDSGDELVPVELSAIEHSIRPEETIVKIACGAAFSALLTNKGSLYVWGRNDSGQLGLGEESQGDMHSAERYPRPIPFFEKSGILVKDIVCGENHIVALTDNGAVYYWGDRAWLEPHLVSLPEANGGIAGIKEIAAGSKFSLVLTNDGLLFGWGANKTVCASLAPTLIAPSSFGNQKILSVHANRNRCSVATSTRELVATTDQEAQDISRTIRGVNP